MAEILSEFGHLVGLAGGNNIQATTMPTYSSVPLGTIVQYIGSTTADYINGYFYKATATGWEQHDTQPAMPNTYPANRVGYDNTTSELEATNTQDAIDEVVDIVADKVDKVASPTAGNLAGLNASGNLTDAGWSADKTTSNASGNPISISGLKSNQLAINPVITLEPIQAGSGDPSPSNVRAISGYDKIEVLSCRKNILENKAVTRTMNGVQYTINQDGSFIANRIETSSQSSYIVITNADNIIDGETPFKAGLTIKATTGVEGYNLSCKYSNGTYDALLNDVSITLPYDIVSIFLEFLASSSPSNMHIYPMVRVGGDNTWESYNPLTNIQHTLGQTIYGGTLDVEKGILTVDRGYAIFDGSSDEGWEFAGAGYQSLFAAQQELTNCADGSVTHAYENWFSSYSPSIYYEQSNAGANPHIISYDRISNYIYVNYGAVITLETFKTNLASHPLQICYELETPFTIQLTPKEISLLKDYAYVSTNGTNMSFSYKNGEIASLGDVEVLGNIINNLGISRVFYTFDSAVTIAAQNAIGYDIDSMIPSGYQPISIVFDRYASQANTITPWLIRQDGKWYAYLYNYYTTDVSIQPRLYIYCIKY